jgi:hypothetical protein
MMYTELKVGEANRIEIGRPSFRRFWSRVGHMTVGLILVILALSALPLATVAVAAPVEDVPCAVCDEASDPVQYTTLLAAAVAKREASVAASAARYSGLAEMYASGREAGAASGAGLMIGIPSDPTQLVPLNARAVADREASVAASAARYSALAAMYASDRAVGAARGAGLMIGIPSDPTQLVPLNARAVADREASVAASAARYSALAAMYAADREMDASSEASLALGIPSNPTQLVPLNARALAESRMDASSEASSALGIPSDPTWLVPLNARAVAREEASLAASAAAFSAYAARLEALADCYGLGSVLCSIR